MAFEFTEIAIHNSGKKVLGSQFFLNCRNVKCLGRFLSESKRSTLNFEVILYFSFSAHQKPQNYILHSRLTLGASRNCFGLVSTCVFVLFYYIMTLEFLKFGVQ